MKGRLAALLFADGCLFVAAPAPVDLPGVADTPFVQEYRTELPYPRDLGADRVRAVAVAANGTVWIASQAGVYRHDGATWQLVKKGSTYALTPLGGDMWAGAWDGLYRLSGEKAERISGVGAPVVALWADGDGLVAAGQTFIAEWDGKDWTSTPWKGSRAVRSVARDSAGGLWVATSMGAYYSKGQSLSEYHDENELLAGELRGVALAPDGGVWLAGLGGVDVYRQGRRAEWYNTANGMPDQNARCIAVEADGTVWVGTRHGVVRRMGGRWSLRHSRRWLPSDSVLSIAVARDNTVWVATTGGLSAIRRRTMTMAEKAAYYLDICLARHVRPPYLVEACLLKSPGDVNNFAPRDDDNDGQYTGMYLGMESYRYAVTKDPQARENARKAFRGLKFLQEVTGTSGFFARTVVPSDWKRVSDPNEEFTPEKLADRLVENPRNKAVEQRWHLSADGKWLWKGDTSSDEMAGHIFGYFTYYTLAAGEAERKVVADHVRRIVDYIIEGGYTLRDIDGQPTRWGCWGPQYLNNLPDWRAEKWTNGLEILAYLRAAEVMTGDPKYRRHYLGLIGEHRYDRLARRPLAIAPSELTHFDNELVALVLPAAMSEQDSHIRSIYEDALHFWLPRIKEQYSSYYSFTWAAMSGSGSPEEFALNRCVEFLRDEPLDLVQWTVDNRWREDVHLVHKPQLEDLQTDRVLPPSERATMRWDGNPYAAIRGSNGMVENSGVHWLLAYWKGRYYGFIKAPEE
ncbi:MAG: hypothetical protein LLG20_25760 [Acidobacteriales bacterium]|nr:hypothetical protein [Terriglobales bacterium]